MPEDESQIDSQVAKRFDDLGSKIGGGRHKDVFALGEDKVLTVSRESGKPPEYFKAQFYMQRVLHGLMPDNFPEVDSASAGVVVLKRVPDTPDFARAKEIERIYQQRKKEQGVGSRDSKDEMWIDQKQTEILAMPEFQQTMALLKEITAPSPERTSWELALPTNTVVVNGHPIIVELFDPATQGKLTLIVDRVKREINQRELAGQLEEEEAKRLRAQIDRYEENSKKLI